MNAILIYSDLGVSDTSVREVFNWLSQQLSKNICQICIVDANYIKKNELAHDVKLIIIPGGRSLPYYYRLGDIGNQKIRAYVKNGGNYLGICAGAYYGASHTIFSKGEEIEVIKNGALNFYQGVAEGPIYDRKFQYGSEKGAWASVITYNGVRGYIVYYNGGCHFYSKNHQKRVKNLATYQDFGNKNAIIECTYYQGKAILSGVHFEFSRETIKSLGLPCVTGESELRRQELCQHILNRFGL